MLRRISLPIFLLFSTVLLAQTTPDLRTTGEEVVVTGTRFERPADDVLSNVTVIDSATIARHVDLGQVLNEQAGVVVNGIFSSPGQNRSLFLRNGANQYTLLLLDGQPLTDPSSLSSAVDLRNLDLSGIERIEILRGAQSLIYGSDAVGGVINLITKKGEAGARMRVQLRGEAQSYDTYVGGVNLSGSLEKLSYQLGYEYFDSKGFSAALEPEDYVGEDFDDDGASRQTATASLNYRPTAEISIRPALRYATFKSDFDQGAFADADFTLDNELVTPSLAVDYTKENLQVGARYNYVASNRDFVDFGERQFKGRQQQADLFSNQVFGDLTTTQGIQLRLDDLLSTSEGVEDTDATTVSPYVQATWRTTPDLSFEGGVRYTNHSEFGGQFNYSFGGGYAINDKLSARLSTATAYQSPTLDQLFGPFGPNPDLQPQESTSYEIGVTYTSTNDEFSAGITGFQRKIEEVVIYNFAPGTPTDGYQNRDELLDRGVEFVVRAQVVPYLKLDANLTYVKGELSTLDFAGTDETVDEFPRRPRFTGFVGATYQATPKLLVRATASHTGERPDLRFNPDFSSTELDLDPFTLINLYAEYQLLEAQQTSVFAEVRNLTNTEFVEISGFTTQGINFRVGVRGNLVLIK